MLVRIQIYIDSINIIDFQSIRDDLIIFHQNTSDKNGW